MKDCNLDEYLSILVSFFTDRFADVPYCKTNWIVCENHARIISNPDLHIQVQVLE